jgi:hypothetical protein
MKKLVAVGSLIGILMCGVWTISLAQTPTNFSGTWVLDKERTRDLPPQLESYTLIVTQNDQQIAIETKVAGSLRPAAPGGSRGSGGGFPGAGRGGSYPGGRMGGGFPGERSGGEFPGGTPEGGIGFPGGRGGSFPDTPMPGANPALRGRALSMVIPQLSYNLDGKETETELGDRTPGLARLKAKWKKDGKVLELSVVRKLDFQGTQMTISTKEQWELSEDGKVLKLKRTVNLPMGSDEVKLVFNKG